MLIAKHLSKLDSPSATETRLVSGACEVYYSALEGSIQDLPHELWEPMLEWVTRGFLVALEDDIDSACEAFRRATRLALKLFDKRELTSGVLLSIGLDERFESFVTECHRTALRVFLKGTQSRELSLCAARYLKAILNDPGLLSVITDESLEDIFGWFASTDDYHGINEAQKTAYSLATAALTEDVIRCRSTACQDGNDVYVQGMLQGVVPERLLDTLSLSSEHLSGSRKPCSGDIISPELFGNILAWLLFIEKFCGPQSPVLLRTTIAMYLRETGILASSLSNWLPYLQMTAAPNTQIKSSADVGGELSEMLSIAVQNVDPRLAKSSHSFMQSVMGCVCRVLPTEARLWYSGCDRGTSVAITKYITEQVTPSLLSREVAAIRTRSAEGGDELKVSSSHGGREIAATYTQDEIQIVMVLKLPSSYPLRAVEVECASKLGVGEALWRKWLLQMKTLLDSKNGTIADGILQWKDNVDKHFEGIEECSICYSVVHLSNGSLPKLSCKTCNCGYHAACLYKWFTTSGKSNCPMCTNPWAASRN